jgi:hypothetical protein
MSKPRTEKLEVLGLDVKFTKKQISDDVLDKMYNDFITKKEQEEMNKRCQHIKDAKGNKIPISDPKYKLGLKFINALLVKLGKDKIDDITQFKDIRRDNLLGDGSKEILNEYIEKLAFNFGRTKLQYNKKDVYDTYVLSVLRSITTILGYKFVTKRNRKKEALNNSNKTAIVEYSIF